MTLRLPHLSKALAALLLAHLAMASPAQAQSGDADQAAAEALYDQAKRLFKKRDYAAACAKFDASRKLDVAVGTLLYLGDCYEKIGKTASAWAVFKEAASEAKRRKDAGRAKIALVRAAALKPQLSTLTVRVPTELKGLEVLRNGRPIPKGSYGTALPVDPGTQTLEARARGYEPWTQRIDVRKGGAAAVIEVPDLIASGPQQSATSAEPKADDVTGGGAEDSSGSSALQISGITITAVGAVGMVVGSVLGGLAGSKNSDSLEQCSTPTICSIEGAALRESAQDLAGASTVTFIAGGATAAIGITLWVLSATAYADSDDGAKRGGRGFDIAGFDAAVSPEGGQLLFRGSW